MSRDIKAKDDSRSLILLSKWGIVGSVMASAILSSGTTVTEFASNGNHPGLVLHKRTLRTAIALAIKER